MLRMNPTNWLAAAAVATALLAPLPALAQAGGPGSGGPGSGPGAAPGSAEHGGSPPGAAPPGRPGTDAGTRDGEAVPPLQRRSGDQDLALEAVRNQLALPLDQILLAASHITSATFLDAVLEPRDGSLIYRLRMLEPSGDVHEYVHGADTGALVEVR